eukprot:scaffold68423_cov73-Phaeocystis_antarctica.AAC.3
MPIVPSRASTYATLTPRRARDDWQPQPVLVRLVVAQPVHGAFSRGGRALQARVRIHVRCVR